jgi:hypothetical protein
MFEVMRRLHPRGTASTGITVDPDGAMLGPDCILVRRTADGYRCVSCGEAEALQEFLFADGMELGWLFGQCRRIAKALDGGEIAMAQIFGLRIPIDNLDDASLKQLAAAAPFVKANFSPDEPRIPAGQPGGGEWTDGSSTSPTEIGAETVAYPGDYHDAVAKALNNYLTSNGGKVVTGITLTAINGTSAVADMIVRLPAADPFIIEVKTGPGAQFTNPQRIVYPMAQVGGHVSSTNAALKEVGLTPGEPLPPLDVYIYWVIKPGTRGKFIKLPAPELLP